MAALPSPAPDQILRIHCIKVFVRDQGQSLRFYVDQLGFRLVADTALPSGERWLAVAPPDGDTVLALVAPKPDSKLYQLIGRPADVVFVTDDVLARYRDWSRRGVKFLSTPKLRRVKSAGMSILPVGEAPLWGGVFTHFSARSRFIRPSRSCLTATRLDRLERKLMLGVDTKARKLLQRPGYLCYEGCYANHS